MPYTNTIYLFGNQCYKEKVKDTSHTCAEREECREGGGSGEAEAEEEVGEIEKRKR